MAASGRALVLDIFFLHASCSKCRKDQDATLRQPGTDTADGVLAFHFCLCFPCALLDTCFVTMNFRTGAGSVASRWLLQLTKRRNSNGKSEQHAQMFELIFVQVLADAQPQTECEWRECLEALQEQPAPSDWCLSDPDRVRNPEIPRDFLNDNPDMVANSSMLHDKGGGQPVRVRTITRTKLMLHGDKMEAKRALDTRQLEQLRQADREDRHAGRLLTYGWNLWTLMNCSDHRFEDITGGERPPADEVVPEMDEDGTIGQPTVAEPLLVQAQPLVHLSGGGKSTFIEC